MKTPALLALFLVGAASILAGSEPVEHTNADGRYKVVFPGKPKLSTIKGQANLSIHISAVEGPSWALTVNYYDIPVDLPTNEEFVKKGLLNEAKTLFTLLKGDLKSHKYAKFQKDLWSIEYTGAVTKPYDAHVRARTVAAGKRIYNVVVMGSPDFVKSESAQKFFDSFQITK